MGWWASEQNVWATDYNNQPIFLSLKMTRWLWSLTWQLHIFQYDRLTIWWTKEVRETHRTTKLRLRELKSVSVNRKDKGLLLIKKKHWSLRCNSVWKIQTTGERNLNSLANFSIKTLGGREVNLSANKFRDFAFSPIPKYPDQMCDHNYNPKSCSKI